MEVSNELNTTLNLFIYSILIHDESHDDLSITLKLDKILKLVLHQNIKGQSSRSKFENSPKVPCH